MSWEQCTGGVKATRLLLLISLFSTHVKGGDVLFDGGGGYCFPSDTTSEKEFFRCCLLCCRCIVPPPLKYSSHTHTHLMLRNTGPNSHAACTFLLYYLPQDAKIGFLLGPHSLLHWNQNYTLFS